MVVAQVAAEGAAGRVFDYELPPALAGRVGLKMGPDAYQTAWIDPPGLRQARRLLRLALSPRSAYLPDAVVLLDAVTADDLAKYRAIVESMPQSELACGFVGSVTALVAWPRHELFRFYNDTFPICGNLPEIPPFTIDEAMEAARIGTSGIYHAACHAVVFDGDAAIDILESLYKGAFFTLIIAIDLVRGSTTRWYTVPQLAGTCQCGMRERNEGRRLRPSPFRCWIY